MNWKVSVEAHKEEAKRGIKEVSAGCKAVEKGS